MSRFRFPVLLILAMLPVGCASVVSGTSQKISVDSIPQGALVTIDGQALGKTPLVTKVSRKKNHEIWLKREGYEEESRVTYKGNNNMVLGNILIGGLIGLAIDYSTGAAYSVDPDQFVVRLTAAGSKAPEPDTAAEPPAAEPAGQPEEEAPR